MPRYFVALLLLALFACGCGAASPSANSPPQVSARAFARSTVETLQTVWLVTSKACVDVATAEQDSNAAADCAKYLDPAKLALLTATNAVDAWTDEVAANFPCLVADVLQGLQNAKGLVAAAGVGLPQVVLDGLEIAQAYSPMCVRVDAGPADAAKE